VQLPLARGSLRQAQQKTEDFHAHSLNHAQRTCAPASLYAPLRSAAATLPPLLLELISA
jgi:hypothetical protein